MVVGCSSSWVHLQSNTCEPPPPPPSLLPGAQEPSISCQPHKFSGSGGEGGGRAERNPNEETGIYRPGPPGPRGPAPGVSLEEEEEEERFPPKPEISESDRRRRHVDSFTRDQGGGGSAHARLVTRN